MLTDEKLIEAIVAGDVEAVMDHIGSMGETIARLEEGNEQIKAKYAASKAHRGQLKQLILEITPDKPVEVPGGPDDYT